MSTFQDLKLPVCVRTADNTYLRNVFSPLAHASMKYWIISFKMIPRHDTRGWNLDGGVDTKDRRQFAAAIDVRVLQCSKMPFCTQCAVLPFSLDVWMSAFLWLLSFLDIDRLADRLAFRTLSLCCGFVVFHGWLPWFATSLIDSWGLKAL